MLTKQEHKIAQHASYRKWYEKRGCQQEKKKYYENRKAIREYQLGYQKRNKELIARKVFFKNIRTRKEVIEHYGGKCVYCGETDLIVLSIDHIDNKGSRHRQDETKDFYRWLQKHNYPSANFQVLCRNCNWRKYIQIKMKKYNLI